MASDVLIVPGSSLIKIVDSSSVTQGIINLDGSGNLVINANTGLNLGDTSSDVFIGDGVNSVDIVFEVSIWVTRQVMFLLETVSIQLI